MHRGREDEYGKTQCVLPHYVCMYVINCDSFFPPPPFLWGRRGGVSVTNFCMTECCTGWIYVGNFALIPSKLLCHFL